MNRTNLVLAWRPWRSGFIVTLDGTISGRRYESAAECDADDIFDAAASLCEYALGQFTEKS